MSSKSAQEINLELQKATVDAANLYTRVLELQIKAVAEGANPLSTGRIREVTNMAADGLHKELTLLHSLRHGLIDAVAETESQDARSRPSSGSMKRT